MKEIRLTKIPIFSWVSLIARTYIKCQVEERYGHINLTEAEINRIQKVWSQLANHLSTTEAGNFILSRIQGSVSSSDLDICYRTLEEITDNQIDWSDCQFEDILEDWSDEIAEDALNSDLTFDDVYSSLSDFFSTIDSLIEPDFDSDCLKNLMSCWHRFYQDCLENH